MWSCTSPQELNLTRGKFSFLRGFKLILIVVGLINGELESVQSKATLQLSRRKGRNQLCQKVCFCWGTNTKKRIETSCKTWKQGRNQRKLSSKLAWNGKGTKSKSRGMWNSKITSTRTPRSVTFWSQKQFWKTWNKRRSFATKTFNASRTTRKNCETHPT